MDVSDLTFNEIFHNYIKHYDSYIDGECKFEGSEGILTFYNVMEGREIIMYLIKVKPELRRKGICKGLIELIKLFIQHNDKFDIFRVMAVDNYHLDAYLEKTGFKIKGADRLWTKNVVH